MLGDVGKLFMLHHGAVGLGKCHRIKVLEFQNNFVLVEYVDIPNRWEGCERGWLPACIFEPGAPLVTPCMI